MQNVSSTADMDGELKKVWKKGRRKKAFPIKNRLVAFEGPRRRDGEVTDSDSVAGKLKFGDTRSGRVDSRERNILKSCQNFSDARRAGWLSCEREEESPPLYEEKGPKVESI